jgi:hypothetical protein
VSNCWFVVLLARHPISRSWCSSRVF